MKFSCPCSCEGHRDSMSNWIRSGWRQGGKKNYLKYYVDSRIHIGKPCLCLWPHYWQFANAVSLNNHALDYLEGKGLLKVHSNQIPFLLDEGFCWDMHETIISFFDSSSRSKLWLWCSNQARGDGGATTSSFSLCISFPPSSPPPWIEAEEQHLS